MVALGIAAAATILFVGTAGSIMPKIVRSWAGLGESPDLLLTNAVLLNIALLIFGWRRYKDLQLEVEERRKAEARAIELAERDELTGCLNRRSAPKSIEALCRQAAQTGQDLFVLVIDIDNFKQINDLHGHRAGDELLRVLAQRITETLPSDGLLARFGGDEFVCAVPFAGNARAEAEHLVSHLMTKIAAPIPFDDTHLDATASIGISSCNAIELADAAYDAEGLINRADIAMYQAKKQGRDRSYWFEPSAEDELKFRHELIKGMRAGIPRGEFIPFYEQQVLVRSGKLVGFEMLARWQSPSFGLVSPEVFVPIAEEIDLIAPLSEGLIRQAMCDALEWDSGLTLSVNVSPMQLRDPWFAHKVIQMMVETGFPAPRLEIEITESCLHTNIAEVRSILCSLKNLGVGCSLDDFGTGFSSLAQLQSLPFDRLKIDRSFVAELTGEEGNAELVEAIIALGKGLQLPMTAEGVEDEHVLALLKDMGELKGQGYHFGTPEDAAATRERLRALGLLRADLMAAGPGLEVVARQRRAG